MYFIGTLRKIALIMGSADGRQRINSEEIKKNKQKTFRESIRRKLKLGQIECTRMYDYTVAEIHLPMEKVKLKTW